MKIILSTKTPSWRHQQLSIPSLFLDIPEIRQGILTALKDLETEDQKQSKQKLKYVQNMLLGRLDEEWIRDVLRYMDTAINISRLRELEKVWSESPNPQRVSIYRSHILQLIHPRSDTYDSNFDTPETFIHYPNLQQISIYSEHTLRYNQIIKGKELDSSDKPQFIFESCGKPMIFHPDLSDTSPTTWTQELKRKMEEEILDRETQVWGREEFNFSIWRTSPSAIRSIGLSIHGNPPWFPELLGLVPFLKVLDWDIEKDHDSLYPENQTILELTFPLLAGLEELEINILGASSEIELIARSCPNLKKLVLSRIVGAPDNPEHSLGWKGRCTTLEVLRILDGRVGGLEEFRDDIGFRTNALLWDIGVISDDDNEEVEEEEGLVGLLDLPNLKLVRIGFFAGPIDPTITWLQDFLQAVKKTVPFAVEFKVGPMDVEERFGSMWKDWQKECQQVKWDEEWEEEKRRIRRVEERPGWKWEGTMQDDR